MAARVVGQLRSGSGAGFSSMTASRVGGSSAPAAKYEGTTNGKGEPHGEGKRVFSSGHIYEGKWQDGRCHGFGKFTYPDGQIFEGEWKDGRRNGEGKLSMPSGEVIAGTWVDDSLSGPVRRWHAAESAPPAAAASRSAAAAPAPAAAAPAKSGGASSADATSAADVAWLRESHDVIWQLNVELQMENERLVGENRRLRLKLRQMLQEKTVAPAAKGNSANGSGDGDGKPKVVEGRLRRKKKGDKEDVSKLIGHTDKAWLEKLIGGTAGSELEAFLSGKTSKKEDKASEESDVERRRRMADELCSKAESELTDRLLTSEWGPMKRIGNSGDAEAYARSVLKSKLDKVRHSAAAFLGDGQSLAKAAADARDGLDAVLGWPSRLASMQSKSGLDPESMVRATELKLDGCGLGSGGVGAACVLLRASRALQTVNLGNNQLGDEGTKMLCEVLKSNSSLHTLRLYGNGIGADGGTALADLLAYNHTLTKLDLRGNSFDARSEAALRSSGGNRVVIHESDNRPVPVQSTASDFMDYKDRQSGVVPPAAGSSNAAAFLDYTDSKQGYAPPAAGGSKAEDFLRYSKGVAAAPPSERDAEAFNSFSRGVTAPYSSAAAGPTPSAPSSSADAFLAFGGGGGGSGGTGGGGTGSAAAFLSGVGSAPVSGGVSSLGGTGSSDASDFLSSLGGGAPSKPRGVSFGAGASKPSMLSKPDNASDFLKSLGS